MERFVPGRRPNTSARIQLVLYMNVVIQMILPLFLMFCAVAALLFTVRIIIALFSPKVLEQMRKRPMMHVVWGCFALVGVLFFRCLKSGNALPRFVERQGQRAKVVQRVAAAGGWAALQKDCDALAAQYQDSAFARVSRPYKCVAFHDCGAQSTERHFLFAGYNA